MTRIDIEKKITEILFRRGYVLTYEEVEPSSSDDMYEITFYLENDKERTIYRITEENKSLREQAVNNEALVQILAEARSALVADDSYDSDDIGYYKKAA